jgi:hypothetical protein
MSKSIVIRGAELYWAKLDAPVNPFNNPQPHWELQIRTRNKAESSVWENTHKLNVTLKNDEFGDFWQVNLKSKAFTRDGKPRKPVEVVDGNLMPIDKSILGNGSIGNVQIDTYTYTKPNKGIGFSLKAVQVTKLVEYKSNGIAFEDEGETEIVVPTDTNEDDSDW